MDKVTLVKREVQSAAWTEKVKERQSSGMSVVRWCEANGINTKTYYYHLRKIREKAVEQIPVPVGALPETSAAAVTVQDASGMCVRIADGTSAQTIEAVIHALKC
jgi:thiamine biosynthesis protein ThiC